MVEIFDYFPILLSVIAIVIAPLLVYFWRQNSTTIQGTIKLETYYKDLERLEEEQKDGFRTTVDKLDIIIRKQDNHEWRLNGMEKELQDIREKKISVLETELGDLKNHKARINYIENEIKELRRDNRGGYGRNGGDKSPL